jgi:NADH-quinone oxidoreductase subunit N
MTLPVWLSDSVCRIGPELMLLATLILVVIADLFKSVPKRALMVTSLFGLLAAGVILLQPYVSGAKLLPERIFQGSAVNDGLSVFFKCIFVGLGVLTVLFSWPVIARWATGQGEFFAILLSCLFGMMIMASANDLLMMFLSLEFVSVTSYIMTGVLRRTRLAAEASLKYIIYGSAAAGVMLYGMSYLYGLSGHLEVTAIGQALIERPPSKSLALIISVLVMSGFAYKVAAAPFHMWCPDVYEGAATPVTAFFSIGPKLAGFAMLTRFLTGLFPPEANLTDFNWKLVIAAMAILTLAFGNFGALFQNNLKRLMAYSGIAHAGYMLLAFVVFKDASIAALMFYSVVYLIMNLGAFLVVIVLEEKYGIETVDGCRGIGWHSPFLGASMTIFLFSLVGIPPLAGFAGKLMLFGALVEDSVVKDKTGAIMAVIGVLFSAISLYYYARIIVRMYLNQPTGEFEERKKMHGTLTLVGIMAVLTFVLGIWWGWLYDLATASASVIGLR